MYIIGDTEDVIFEYHIILWPCGILLKLTKKAELSDIRKSAFFNWHGLDTLGYNLSTYFAVVPFLFLNSFLEMSFISV